MKEAIFNISNTKLITAIKKAANELGLELEESTNNEIIFYHSGGLLSFGNRITVRISQSGNSSFKVNISSISAAQVQIIDWGTNHNLEDDLISELKRMIAK